MNRLISIRPCLDNFQRAGVLVLADVLTASRVCRMAGETDDNVMLAVALTVRAVRHGSVCLELDRFTDVGVESEGAGGVALDWPSHSAMLDAVRQSRLVTGSAAGPLRPLRLVDREAGSLLYLDRYFLQENLIRNAVTDREGTRPDVDVAAARAILNELFTDAAGSPSPASDRQRVAAAVAATEWTAIVAGGPGTGKTHTVARVLALLFRLYGDELRVALAAPTGKAAATLTEAVAAQTTELDLPDGLVATTLHRLLGWRPGSTRFRHDARNRLPYDVVVVDETSMVSVTMMARLFEALSTNTRLILMGDPDQLTSVDAGAVLADLVARRVDREPNVQAEEMVAADLAVADSIEPPPGTSDASTGEVPLDADDQGAMTRGVVRLRRGRRFNQEIGDLADAVRRGNVEETLLLLSSSSEGSSLHAPGDLADIRESVVSSGVQLIEAARGGDIPRALAALGEHRLLCAHRDGQFGQRRWADLAVEWIVRRTGRALDTSEFYLGQPILVTANDYQTRVFNGDIGVVVTVDGGITAAIERGREPLLVSPYVLAGVQTAYASTIHRSQGSQYRSVTVVLPKADSPLLTRQLLYTAITRGRDHVRIVGTQEAVAAAVGAEVRRASGLPVGHRSDQR
jgi:exodeoxyribonuclease V alpha subunit